MMSNFSTPITKSFGSIGSVDLDARTFEAWASVEAVDRDREYVPISAFLDNLPIYMNNPVLLLGHQHKTTKDSLPIGKCLKLEHRGNGLWGKFYLATTQVGDDCLRLINEKCIAGLSCGFVPIKFIPHPADSQLPPELRGKGISKYYETVELVEISLLSIPSNRDSLVIQAEKGNRVANVILKGFDGEDTTNILQEWLIEEKALGKKNSLWLGFSLSNDSKDELNKLSLDGKKCPKDELHLTLRYFGNVDDKGEVERLKNTLSDLQYSLALSYDLDPMDFETFKDDSLVARYANTKLSQLHESVNSLLDRDGLIYLEEFKFLKPHVTVSEGKDLLIPVGKPPKIKTDRLSLRWGDEVIQEFMPLRGTWDQFTTKVFGMWEEEEHPRDDDGQFTSKPSSSVFGPHDPKDQNINQKLDNILINQRKLNKDVQEIKDKDSWNAWAKNWVVKIGAVAGLYYGIKHAARNPEVRAKIRNWLLNVATKEAKETDSIDKLLSLLTLTKKMIDNGKKLGARGQEYARLEKFYLKMVEQLRNSVVPVDNEIRTKEMTPEEFVEAEHPRASDGKFTDKNKGSGAKKTKVADKPQEVSTEDIDVDVEKKKKIAAKIKKTRQEREMRARKIDLIVTATLLSIIVGFNIYRRRVDKITKDSQYRAYEQAREAFRTSSGPNRDRFKQQADESFENIFNKFKQNEEEFWSNFSKQQEQTFSKHKEQQQSYSYWDSAKNEEKRKKQDEEFRKAWDDFFNSFGGQRAGGQRAGGQRAGGQRAGDGGAKTKSEFSFETGPTMKEGTSEIFRKMENVRNSAKLLVHQINEGGYNELPVPRDSMGVVGALRMFNAKLKKEAAPGWEVVHKDTEDTLTVLERLIKENWKKHGIPDTEAASGFKKPFTVRGFEDIISKEMSPEEFVEAEHPRANDGKFTDKGKGNKTNKPTEVAQQPDLSQSVPREHMEKFYNWAKEHKGSLLVAAASTPVIFSVVKAGLRTDALIYSKQAKEVVSWENVVKSGQSKKVYDLFQPGDIILSGTVPYGKFGDLAKDVKALAVSAVGKKTTKTAVAKDRLFEFASKVALGGQYTHSFLCLGPLNKDVISKISAGEKAKANNILYGLASSIKTDSALSPNGRKLFPALKDANGNNLPQNLKEAYAKGYDFTKVDFSPYFGYPMRVQGGRGTPSLGIFLAPHSGTQTRQEVSMAIARTKLSKEQLGKVVDGTLDDIINQKQTGIVHPWNMSVLVRPAASGGILDPITGKLVKGLFRNDQVVCSGVIAKLFERHGAKYTKDASVVTPMDFIKDKRIASEVFLPKKVATENLMGDTLVRGEKISVSAKPDKAKEISKIKGNVRDIALTGAIGVGTTAASNKIMTPGVKEEVETKEMSAEEFKEEEHPRDDDGKFRDKNSAAEPSPDSGAWGGARKNAGRTSRDPIKAKIKLEERFRAENPNINDEELKQKIMDHGVKTGNPDLVLLASDPVAYQKKRDQEIAEAMATKRNSTVVNNKKVPRSDTPENTSAVYNELVTTKSEWQKELTQASSVQEAIRVFQGKHSDEMDMSRAKLTMAAATIALAVGLGVMYAKRPKFTGFNITPGAGRGVSPIGLGGTSDPLAIDPQWLRYVNLVSPKKTKAGKIIQETEAQQIARRAEGNYFPQEVGALTRIISNINKRIYGKTKAPVLGEKVLGMTHERFNIKKFEYLNTKHPNYKFEVGDTDPTTGAILLRGDPKSPQWDAIGLAIANKRIKLYPSKSGVKNYPPGLTRGNNGGWEYLEKVAVVTKKDGTQEFKSGEEVFANWLSQNVVDGKGKVKYRAVLRKKERAEQDAPNILSVTGGDKYEVPRTSVPEGIVRLRKGWGEAGGPQDVFQKVAEQSKGWSEFFNKKVIGPLSGRTLAMLTVASGSIGTGEAIFYFQKDIERFLSSMLKQQGTEEEAAHKAQEAVPGSKVSNKQEIAKIKAEEKKAKAQTQRAKAQTVLEMARENVINELIRLGVRDNLEGFRTDKSLTEQTIRKHLTDSFLRTHGYSGSAQGWVDFASDLKAGKPEAMTVFSAVVDRMLEEKRAEKDNITPEDIFRSQREEQDARQENLFNQKTQGSLLLDLITKAFGPIEEDDQDTALSLDDLITDMAEEIASMISDISQSCKLVVQSGMPTNSEYAQLNDIVTEIYSFLKDNAKKGTQEVSQKSFDGVMTSQSDQSGGLLAKKDKVAL